MFVTIFALCKSTFCTEEIACTITKPSLGKKFATKGDGEDKKDFEFCRFNSIELTNESLPVNINTSLLTITNDQVQLVDFKSKVVKFIPYQIFKTFPNLIFLYANGNIMLEKLKPSYFKGATNLKIVRIMHNLIRSLVGNLFAEAKSIEIINFQDNQIETIHVLAFNGLNNLEFLYLGNNLISKVQYTTFSMLKNLKVLNLSGSCAKKVFTIDGGNMTSVEDELKLNCKLTAMEILEVAKKDFDVHIHEMSEEILAEKQKQENNMKALDTIIEDLKNQMTIQSDQLKEKNKAHIVLMDEKLKKVRQEIVSIIESANENFTQSSNEGRQDLVQQNQEQKAHLEETQTRLRSLSLKLEEEMKAMKENFDNITNLTQMQYEEGKLLNDTFSQMKKDFVQFEDGFATKLQVLTLSDELNSFVNGSQKLIQEIYSQLDDMQKSTLSRRSGLDNLDTDANFNTTDILTITDQANFMGNFSNEQNLVFIGIMTTFSLLLLVVMIYTCSTKKSLDDFKKNMTRSDSFTFANLY